MNRSERLIKMTEEGEAAVSGASSTNSLGVTPNPVIGAVTSNDSKEGWRKRRKKAYDAKMKLPDEE